MTRQARAWVEPVRESGSATTLELFFDLVFVFALTQVTAYLADNLTGQGLLHGLLVLAVVWWCWVGYSWLSNVVKADEGVARLAMFVAMLAMFVIALSIPEAFVDMPGGLSGPTVFAVGYLVLRGVHVLLFLMVSGTDPGLRRQVLRFTGTMIGGTALLLAAGMTSGSTQTLLWVAAVLADYGGTLVIGARGWRLNSARHFAERHGLIIIVALGESIVAIGVGVAQLPISWPIVVAAALGLAVSASLWWVYFDTAALLSERALSRARGEHRVAMARSGYTYLHMPMMVGIVLVALGLKKVLEYVGDEEHHTLADKLYGLPLWALYGGAALFLLGQVAFAWRCYRHMKVQRLVLAGVLIALIPLVAALPALASLGVLAGLLALLNVGESIKFAADRAAIRHGGHDEDPELLHVDRPADDP
ncbi:MAG TPA: low temperature requirement protein A [Actinophytocola sp.]|uniref:low temperature requirement protein A n=1 Tax=Actinophytocola sp. TaxID=1872138 RepID=UPI002DBE37A8|nr:low temperature requirement protein A [Actinophytocola sp.]HEU5475214.1 low temperature requirement protein A [Actinophytocola sp.]